MQIVKVVFSPTGGTEKVADILATSMAKELNTDISSIDLSNPFIDESDLSIQKDSFAVIAMPCFGGRVPVVAMERMRKIKGGGTQCVVVNVYGNRDFDDALLEMANGAREAGFKVVAAIAAIAEHSIMHEFAHGRPDGKDVANLENFAAQIAAIVKGGEEVATPRIPGNDPYKKAGGVPLVPKVSSKCVSCGKCAKSCPVTAINSVDYASDKDVCIACMRCIQVCPEKARSISSVVVKGASFAIKKEASVRKETTLYL